MERKERGVYSVWDGEQCVYVGSTSLPLQFLEQNHRQWQRKGYSGTKFRKALTEQRANEAWLFKWVVPRRKNLTQTYIEIQEEGFIQWLRPKYNVDLTPYESSIRYERCERVC